MKYIVYAFALCCLLSITVRADEIVIVPTGGQLSFTHFQGPSSDVASLFVTAVGFTGQATNQETTGPNFSGLCPLNCTGSVMLNGSGFGNFNWSAGTNGVIASGRFNLFGVVFPLPPGTPFPDPLFTVRFTATGHFVIDTPDRFLFVFDDMTAAAVPEPASMLLFGSGLLGFARAIHRRRRRR